MALLALSISAKLAASASVPDPRPDEAAVAAEQMLQDAGYRTKVVRTARSPGVFAVGTKGGCRLLAGEYPVHGTYADVYLELARPVGNLRYAYRGALHDVQPKLKSLLDFFVWRELKRVGVDTPRAAVIAVAATPGCELQTLAWNRVSGL